MDLAKLKTRSFGQSLKEKLKSHHVVYNISNYDFCYKPHRVDIKEIFFSLKDCPKDRAFNFAKSINYVLTF